jgi:cobalamin biosynthesis Co2+ chelatase CbiK
MKILTIDVGLTKHAVHHFIWDNRLVKIDVITQEIVSQIPGVRNRCSLPSRTVLRSLQRRADLALITPHALLPSS